MKAKYEKQLRKCFEKHADAIYRLCVFRLHGDEMLATDIAQEAFYRAGMELEKWTDIKNLKAFVFRVASNLIIDHSRKTQDESLEAKEEAEYTTYATQASPEWQIQAQLELERMNAILDSLPEQDKDIFLLRFVEELAPKEIAQMYDLDTNALTVRLHRLKKKVSDCMKTNT